MADEIQFREATANLNRATLELQKFNESTAAEVGKLVGKNIGCLLYTSPSPRDH